MLNFEAICILIKPSWRVEPLHRGQSILGICRFNGHLFWVYPFLRFDTIEPFPLETVKKTGSVRTPLPGSQDLWFWEVVQFQSSQWKLLKLKVKQMLQCFLALSSFEYQRKHARLRGMMNDMFGGQCEQTGQDLTMNYCWYIKVALSQAYHDYVCTRTDG